MNPPPEFQRTADYPDRSFSKADSLGQALHKATQFPPSDPLSPDFAKRVAEKAHKCDLRRQKKDRKLTFGLIFSIMGLMFLGVIGWQVFRPIGLEPLLEGPLPLVLTAMACLALGSKMAKQPNPRPGL